MSFERFLPYLAVMAVVTYLIRAVPFAMFSKQIKSRFAKSFLYYVPYAVLAVMTVPEIFFSPDMIIAGVAALAVAVLLAYKERGLLTVAMCCSAAVFVTELIAKHI